MLGVVVSVLAITSIFIANQTLNQAFEFGIPSVFEGLMLIFIILKEILFISFFITISILNFLLSEYHF